MLLGQATICVMGTSKSPSLLTSVYGQLIVVFSSIGIVGFLYLIFTKNIINNSGPEPRQRRDTCVSSSYSRIDDDPFEYRISLSIDMDTKPLESRLRTDPALKSSQLSPQNIKKLKLVYATTYTSYIAHYLSSKVNCKIVTPCASSEDTLVHIGGLVNEISMLAQLFHPNILSFIGYAASASSLLDLTLVTEYTSFGCLATTLKDGDHRKQISWTVTNDENISRLQIAKEIASALAYLHSLPTPVVHNGISTQNVYVTSNWEIKLGGFIDAVFIDDVKKDTISWIDAPEVIAGENPSIKSDIYLFGLFLMDLSTSCQGETMPSHVKSTMQLCLEENPTNRPTSSEIVIMLNKS
ncbi:kinase [Thraustotheca clavata]|uniref:Kinase n=1 Tax=Thraustotheca clavata TaxID=74557 RepID=A0A1V9YQE9_9STRA|nr:kinase [Thraustotheca clavata]